MNRARFTLRYARWNTASPWKLRDRARPAFLGGYATREDACRAMDNIVRREQGAPERIGGLLAAAIDDRRVGAVPCPYCATRAAMSVTYGTEVGPCPLHDGSREAAS